jgi:hypothetical protein
MNRRSILSYCALVLGSALVVGAITYFGSWVEKVASCKTTPITGAYLAYCSHPLYGSYEHDAYALGLEPKVVRNLRQAEVLILGNSRTQFAFSTPQVEAFFAERHRSYHVLGFGYAESSRFAQHLIKLYGLHPRALVMNVDPFFTPHLSPPAEMAVAASWLHHADALSRRLFNNLLPLLCRYTSLCTQTFGSIYRNSRTGQWVWQDVLFSPHTRGLDITSEKVSAWSLLAADIWEAEARHFLAQLSIPPSCVILTGVPTPQIDAEGIARELGRRLNLQVFLPELGTLTSPDTSHLSGDSAQRWSEGLLTLIGPSIDACMDAGGAP